jgi:hypothetical protein
MQNAKDHERGRFQKPESGREERRPGLSWMEDAENDLRGTNVNKWRQRQIMDICLE